MTRELAESGKHFITAVINGSDLVPTFSTASVDDLRSEVIASSWLNDLRDQVERTRFLNVVYRSASALGSRLPSIASARARVAGAGALLRPVSSGTQDVMNRARNVAQAVVRTRSSLSSWSCMGARRRAVGAFSNSKAEDDASTQPMLSSRSSDSLMVEYANGDMERNDLGFGCLQVSAHEAEENISVDHVINTSADEEMTEGELWQELEKELHMQDSEAREEEAAAAREITEEENVVMFEAAEKNSSPTTPVAAETQRFYPPGRIMHIVSLGSPDANSGDDDPAEETIGIYETPRDLYTKLRLSKTMIKDHYMPMYKKMIEQLIAELKKDVEDCINT
ncbi:hypothetical protein ACLOJK_017746 [Asimina triloba]